MATTEETPASVVLVVRGTIDRSEIPGLCERARRLVEGSGAAVLLCDVGDMVTHDLCTLDALARVALAVRRLGRRFGLRGAGAELQGLVALAGLDDVLPVEARAPHVPERPEDPDDPDVLGAIDAVADACDPPS